jgi:sugar (pentulose or hexulose) kinase
VKSILSRLFKGRFDFRRHRASEGFNLHGALTIEHRKENGEATVLHKDNMILSGGFDFIAACIGAGGQTAMGYIAIGTGTTAVANSQTALVTEVVRQSSTYAHTAGTQVFTLTTTFGAGVAANAYTEAGVVNNSATGSGTFLDRVVFPAINKATNDVITVTFTFTMS